ncbi:Ferric siderophore transport system, periplasmic binding protein TonB [Lysobacter dokdonensis DS-58]|uniref:Protein TonB n=1 Tax=Lysobacter dokdonensis DS-58 TaxID=1300345 RepID=A0A0A2WM93_9GAMM|nr:energy transducer TonB [Lysobacter dokdonensis]KGQ19410.1 Ferric siderophore transport system, periplasmic binding protein TonB [Lysobacter dokdonensis DS-58]
MSTHPSSFGAHLRAWRPSGRGLAMIAAAILAGLVLFLVVWSGQRSTSPAPVRATADRPDFAPLPAPMAGGADGASGLEEPDEEALAERPRLEDAPRREAPVAAAPAAPPPAAAPAVSDASPIPISKPAPRYPQRALRMRETGTVRVLVSVGADGVPTNVSIESSSQSRDLDRAALEAVRKWRFSPAQRGGQAVAGEVVVPIEFKL